MTVLRTGLAGLVAVLALGPAVPAEAASKRHLLYDTFCEFRLGAPIPAATVRITTVKVPDDGGLRVYQRYRACRGKSEVLLELREGVVDTITVTRQGDCIRKLACVGEPYAKVAKRFREAARTLSELEGRTVSLEVTTQATIDFNVQAMPSRCFNGPKCRPTLKPQVVTRLYLHR